MIRMLLAVCCLQAVSCSSLRFGREWRKAVAVGTEAADAGLAGRWEGTWESEVNGHRGKLRCLVEPVSAEEGRYLFRYRATWMRVLSGVFKAEHRVVRQSEDGWRFQGEQRLAKWAGGLYQYEGEIKGPVFEATYRCELDKGLFQMRRVP
jgi:hypothetical protein